MSSFLHDFHDAALGQLHALLNKVIDMNSIPQVEQQVRNLESAKNIVSTQAAVAASHITGLTRQRDNVAHEIEHDKMVVTAFLQKSDEKSAKLFAAKIHDAQSNLDMFNQQLVTATAQSQDMDAQFQTIKTEYAKYKGQLNSLRVTDNARRGAQLTKRSLQEAHDIITSGMDGSVDNITERINAQNDQAQEELKRTIAEFQPDPDPLKDAAVDDILNSLRPAATPPATAAKA